MAFELPYDITKEASVKELDDASLQKYHAFMHIFWDRILEGLTIGWTLEEVNSWHSEIVKELAARKLQHLEPINGLDTLSSEKILSQDFIHFEYNPETLSDEMLLTDYGILCHEQLEWPEEQVAHAKKLIFYEAESRGLPMKFEESYSIGNLDFLQEFADFKIIKDFVCLIGSTVDSKDGHKPHDIDLLVRMQEPNPFLRRAIEVRISKMLPEKLSSKLHFVWGESSGPHDSFVPLYDLKVERIKPTKRIQMQEMELEATDSSSLSQFT